MWGEPKEKGSVNVIVCPFNVGVGMMEYIVLDFPDSGITTYEVHGVPKICVHFLIFGVRSMDGIVHNAHSDSGHSNSTYDIKTKKQQGGYHHSGIYENQGGKKNSEHDHGLQNHAFVGMSTDIVCLKIGADPVSQGF